MKFMVVSRRGEGVGIVNRLLKEDHQATLVALGKFGQGIVPTLEISDEQMKMPVLSFARFLEKAASRDTIFVFTSHTFGQAAQQMVKDGYPVLGAGSFHEMASCDDEYMKMLSVMCNIGDGPKMHQDKIVLEAWFNGDTFISPCFCGIQDYHFMPGDLGLITECAGVTAFAFKSSRPQIFRETLELLGPALKKVSYKGPVSVDLGREGILRYIFGFRFDFFLVTMPLIQGSLAQLLSDLVFTYSVKRLDVSFEYGVGIRASFPPYPLNVIVDGSPETTLGFAGQAARKEDLDVNVCPLGVYEAEGVLKMASPIAPAFCCSGYGSTIKEAQTDAYKRITPWASPGIQFRIDIGASALQAIGGILQYGNKREPSNGSSKPEGDRSHDNAVVA